MLSAMSALHSTPVGRLMGIPRLGDYLIPVEKSHVTRKAALYSNDTKNN